MGCHSQLRFNNNKHHHHPHDTTRHHTTATKSYTTCAWLVASLFPLQSKLQRVLYDPDVDVPFVLLSISPRQLLNKSKKFYPPTRMRWVCGWVSRHAVAMVFPTH